MCALGQKLTSDWPLSVSALPPKADIEWIIRDVRFVPEADCMRRSKNIAMRLPRRHRASDVGGIHFGELDGKMGQWILSVTPCRALYCAGVYLRSTKIW